MKKKAFGLESAKVLGCKNNTFCFFGHDTTLETWRE